MNQPERLCPIIAPSVSGSNCAVNIIRLSLGHLKERQAKFLLLERSLKLKRVTNRYAHYHQIVDENGRHIDSGLLLFFSSPRSYTGECELEFQCHGSLHLTELIVQRFIELGSVWRLRKASAGEFTRRALLNKKLNLLQASLLNKIISAPSKIEARKLVAGAFGGSLKRLERLYDSIVDLRLKLEASLVFGQEEGEGPTPSVAELSQKINSYCSKALTVLGFIRTNKTNATISILGRPNVGKSSLFNTMTKSSTSIVTPIRGTTRDTVIGSIGSLNWRQRITDTAGIYSAKSRPDLAGICSTFNEIAESSTLIFTCCCRSATREKDRMLYYLASSTNLLVVYNKIDLLWRNRLGGANVVSPKNLCWFFVSVRNCWGTKLLCRSVLISSRLLHKNRWPRGMENGIATLLKHALIISKKIVEEKPDLGLEGILEELEVVQKQLGHILGVQCSSNLLESIFSKFCIGK